MHCLTYYFQTFPTVWVYENKYISESDHLYSFSWTGYEEHIILSLEAENLSDHEADGSLNKDQNYSIKIWEIFRTTILFVIVYANVHMCNLIVRTWKRVISWNYEEFFNSFISNQNYLDSIS
jgi:hypothetical protein